MRLKENVYLFDVRLVDRHLLEGKTTPSEFHGFLKSLPDKAPDAETITGKKNQNEAGEE